jgi:hypothetical protein
LYIGLLPSWGEWVLPRFGPQYFTDERQAYAYGHFIGDRYKVLTTSSGSWAATGTPTKSPTAS